MPLSKLSIFSKDTDANEVVKGYEYQKLRTLEKWLNNKVNKIEEVIYCEYEDDIFQRDIAAGSSKFTQIKLYGSKSFSFKSEEITKAIANFFMLFVKGEYSFDTVQFVFETNTAIAGKYGDNDAELLKEWFDNQNKIDSQLLQKCAEKVKAIVTDYIKEELPKVEKDHKSEAQSAIIDFNGLPPAVWEDFAKSIKWVFNDKSPDDAIEIAVNSIKEFIKELPFPSVEGKVDTVFTTLYYEVSVKMFQNEAEDRCLTSQKIDSLILELGDEADKQYNLSFEDWKETTEIKYFNLAEFIEVLHSSNHCRQSSYLKEHSAFWLNLLNQYIQFGDTPDRYRQKAIYEFLWLSLRPEWLKEPVGSLIGQNQLIEKYFSDVAKFDDHEAIEDNFSLLQIVRASIIMGKSDLPMEKTNAWLKEIGVIIDAKVKSIENPNEKCYWLELQTGYLSNPLDEEGKHFDTDKIFQSYEKLVKLLPEAPLYNVTRLSDRLNQFIKIYIQVGSNDKYVDSLEELADKLMPYVSNRSGNHKLAKTYVDRGIKYLHTTNPHHLAKALDYFHKAKDLWLQGETAEGYVLALLNISQLYSALGMNLAAKYYVLSAAWFSINNNPEKLAKRIAHAFGMLVYCDFKQGSWFNALDSFKFYIRARIDFDERPLNESDEMFMKSLVHVGGILAMAPKISIQLAGFIEFQKQQMGQLYKEFVEHTVNKYEDILSKKSIQNHIQERLDASPINDIGEIRSIEWKSFGSIWQFSFPNTWVYNSLGEEFAATLQILLVELSSSVTDLHFIRTTIEIEIVELEDLKAPEQLASNNSFKWKFFTRKVDVADRDKIRYQIASLIINMKYLLRDVSMIQDDKFFELVDKLFQNESLAEKTMTNNLYQRVYRSLFTKEAFDASQRNIFLKELIPFNKKEDKILEWNSNLSPLYSKEDSLSHIEGRYKNTLKATHLTINHIKTLPGYEIWLKGLREKGWLDWQILLAMFNHVCNYKANRILDGKKFPSEKLWKASFDNAFNEIRKKDESETYVQFPLDFFTEPDFEMQLNHSLWLVLHTWGLENKASFPNFPAIKDILRHRFNVGIDDIKELSPF
jgi:rRNA-processing protein FCF1